VSQALLQDLVAVGLEQYEMKVGVPEKALRDRRRVSPGTTVY